MASGWRRANERDDRPPSSPWQNAPGDPNPYTPPDRFAHTLTILFVCTGNICRSPIAATIARNEINQAGYTKITVASAGTAALSGYGATREAILVVEENGLSLDDHRAQQLTPELIAAHDLVVGMQREHAELARRMGARRAITLSEPVRDPYGRGMNAYRETWTLLNSLIPNLLRELHTSNSM